MMRAHVPMNFDVVDCVAMNWNMETFRTYLGTAADVIGVLGFFGVGSPVAYGAIVVYAGIQFGVNAFWIVVMTPIVICAVLGAVVLSVILVGKKTQTLDAAAVASWRNHEAYSVWVAASLWAGQKPWPSIPADSPSYPALQKLKNAIAMGRLAIVSGDGSMKSVVSRAELERYATEIGERPKFLFNDPA